MPPARGKSSMSKAERQARVNAVYDEFQALAESEEAPAPLTAPEIKKLLNPDGYNQYLYTIRLWEGFQQKQLKQCPGERPFHDGPPSTYKIKMHLRWLAMSRTGVLEDNITDVTLNNRLSCLKRAIRLHTNYVYSKAENEQFSAFIRQDLAQHGLISTAARPKPVASLPVAEDLIHFLWACDEYQELHPRARLQLPFAILLMCSLGTRPGEFIESDAWKNTNEGLLYKDVELEFQDDEDYRGFLLKVRLRNRKGHREYKKHAPVNILPEEPTIRAACPVTYFIAMALADNVFADGNSFKDLASRKVPAGALKAYASCQEPVSLQLVILSSYPEHCA